MFSYEISWPWAWWIIPYSRWAALRGVSFFFGNLFVAVSMYLTFSGKFINYVTFQSKTMSKLGSNKCLKDNNKLLFKKVQKTQRMVVVELLLYNTWPSSTAYYCKCSVANALSVMKNNMGSYSTSKFKKGFQLWDPFEEIVTFWHLRHSFRLEVEHVNFCTIIHYSLLTDHKVFESFFKRSHTTLNKMSGRKKEGTMTTTWKSWHRSSTEREKNF